MRFVGSGTDLANYARSDVQQYIDYLASKKKSASTINKLWIAIKSYSKWAGKNDTIEDIAVVKVADIKKQAPKAMDKIERNKLIRDIDRTGSLVIRTGKGNKERTLPLNVEARRAIEKYLEERTDNHPALFLSNRQERISIRSVQHLMEKHGHNAHQTRHSFITGLVRAGEDISVIQSLSGHSSADMILRYSMPSEEDKLKALVHIYKD